MLVGVASIAVGIMGFAPWKCNLSVLVEMQGASPFSHRLRTQAHADSQEEQFSAPITSLVALCLVLWTVVSTCLCLPVPDCTLQKSLDTHSEGVSLC